MTVNLPTNLLRSFVAIVDAGSMLGAAEQVYLTQSALSLQIKRLEDMVQQPLFVREGRRLVLTAQGVLTGPYVGDMHVIAGLIILVREIAVSGLREFLGGIQVSVPVSKLAKWKTTCQIIALGSLILGKAMPWWNVTLGGIFANVPHTVGLTTLWAAAILTLITGWDYLRVGLKHMD